MDPAELEALARAAGLARVLEEFRDDLIAAALQVERQRQIMAGAARPGHEPWPPMRPPVRVAP
jgi:hypothetical protein